MKIYRGAGEMTQEVKCFMCNSEDPSLIPRTHVKKPELVAHICYPKWVDCWGSVIRYWNQKYLAKERQCLTKNVLCNWLLGERRCSIDYCRMIFNIFSHSVLLTNCTWVQLSCQQCNHFTSDETADHAEIDTLHMVARLGDDEPGLKQNSESQKAAHTHSWGQAEDAGPTVGTQQITKSQQ